LGLIIASGVFLYDMHDNEMEDNSEKHGNIVYDNRVDCLGLRQVEVGQCDMLTASVLFVSGWAANILLVSPVLLALFYYYIVCCGRFRKHREYSSSSESSCDEDDDKKKTELPNHTP
jgi:hypothetical protein